MILKRILLYSGLLLFILSGKFILAEEKDFTWDISNGFHEKFCKGNENEVLEYETSASGFETSFFINGAMGGNYMDLKGEYKDRDEQQYFLMTEKERILNIETKYKRYIHRIDHDDLSQYKSLWDFDKDEENILTLEEKEMESNLRFPLLPWLKLIMGIKDVEKRGCRQATTVRKNNSCTACHVTSKNKRVDSRATNFSICGDISNSYASINYTHTQQKSKDNAPSPLAFYVNTFDAFPHPGFYPYSKTPSIQKREDQIKTHVKFSNHFTIYAAHLDAKAKNSFIDKEKRFKNTSIRLTGTFLNKFIFNCCYSSFKQNNEVEEAVDKNVKRAVFDFRGLFLKRLSLKGGFNWEETERRHSYPGSTVKKTYFSSISCKVDRKNRLTLKYKREQWDEPFSNVYENPFELAITNIPKEKNEISLQGYYSPRFNLWFLYSLLI
ncbi:MAG: hypothetical protein SV062_02095, partial [Thermodesulfobacteriota bacterium]|nr:hypothetical protein [Thermodesulfobacteriota bacterium]